MKSRKISTFQLVGLEILWKEINEDCSYCDPHRHLVQSIQRVLGATAHRGCRVDLPKHSHLHTNMTIPVTHTDN